MAQRGEPDFLDDDNLRVLYERTRGPVAFIDESYRLPGPRGPGFYTMTGVLFDRDDLVEHRRALLAVGRTPGGGPWHTTDAYHEGRVEQIGRVVDVVLERAEWSIVTVEVPMAAATAAAEAEARAVCLSRLAVEFTRPGPQQAQLLVIDTRSEQGDRHDQRLSQQLRGTKEIPGRTVVRHASDAQEPLLSAPDAISWATRRLLAVDDTKWIEPAMDSMTLIHATTNELVSVEDLVLNAQQRRVGLSPVPAPGLDVGPREDGILTPLLPESVSHAGQTGSRQLTPIDELAARAATLRERTARPVRNQPAPSRTKFAHAIEQEIDAPEL